jgi:predicted O-linked N-acetylglucosamine transferase (SPINDLY family)
MDYRLTDGYMDPPGLTEGYHSEQLIRLPLSAPYRPEPMCPDVGELPALAGGGLMLASLNALQKINQNVANLWGKILARIPGSRLMLGNAVDEAACQHLIDLFGRAGVSPDRLVLQPKLSVLEYLALHQQIDLGLDPFPYNGGTTTMHSLWMGVPVVSMAGENMVSRCGVSLLGRVGLDHFIVHDEEEYLQRVLEIASDLPALSAIRKGLRHRVNATSGSFDAIVRDLESTYRLMWKSWCEGAPLTEK